MSLIDRLLEEDTTEVDDLSEEPADDFFNLQPMPLLYKQRATTQPLTPESEAKTATAGVNLVAWMKKRRSLKSLHHS